MRAIPFILDIKEKMGDKSLVGVEIGVYQAEHAELMLKHLNMKKLYLIDPYVDNDPDFQGHMKPKVPAAKAIAHERLKEYDQVVWIEEKSEAAFCRVWNGASGIADFVYIDGNHSYKYVMRDMVTYGALVRSGWLGGHDYTMRSSPLIEVEQAVDDCALLTRSEVHVGSGKYPDWWFRI